MGEGGGGAGSNPAVGFQKSENSGVEVTIYTKGGDPVLLTSAGTVLFDGKKASDPNASLIAASTNKQMGQAGTWSFSLKPSRAADLILAQITDDDWVDIVFRRHGKRWHTMRGIVEGISRSKSIVNGATVTVYTVSGKDFQAVWEKTPIFLNKYTQENIEGGLAQQIWGGRNFSGSVLQTVQAMLYGFLQALNGKGRANWTLPSSMPNKLTNFGDTVAFDAQLWVDDPPRIAVSPSFMAPEGSAWSLAQEWSDPTFCELFTDLYPTNGGQLFGNSTPFGIPDTTMTVVLRDRPFPVVDASINPNGMNSVYFSLPQLRIFPTSITDYMISRGGAERFNAFYVAPQIPQELMNNTAIDLLAPIWETNDILLHGLRRFDVASRYVVLAGNMLTMAASQRAKVRDWYALNPYLFSGNLQLGHGLLEAKVGTRLLINGTAGPTQDESYYIEQVGHSWNFGPGLRTQLGVTRGWIGTDASFLDALQAATAGYVVPARAP